MGSDKGGFGTWYAEATFRDVPAEEQVPYLLDLDCAECHHVLLRLGPGEAPPEEAFTCLYCRGQMGVGGMRPLDPEEAVHLPCPACARGVPPDEWEGSETLHQAWEGTLPRHGHP